MKKILTFKAASSLYTTALLTLTIVFAFIQFGILMNVSIISTVFTNVAGGFTIIKGQSLITFIIITVFLIFALLRTSNRRVSTYRMVNLVAIIYFLIAAILNFSGALTVLSIVYGVINVILVLLAIRITR